MAGHLIRTISTKFILILYGVCVCVYMFEKYKTIYICFHLAIIL